MSPYRFSLFIGVSLLLASCADEMPGSKTSGDGSIAFSVDRAAEAVFSRAGGDTPALSFHKSLPIQAVGNQKIWMHVESAENPASFNAVSSRAMPVTLDDMDEFTVKAILPDGNTFMQSQTVTKNANSNLWKTENTYFWPENDALTFQCQPLSLPSSLTNLTADAAKFSFDYLTPLSADGLNDAEAQPDFVLATHTYSKSDASDGTVNIRFQHPLAGICFVQDESLLIDESLRITKIELTGLYGKGSCEFDGHNPDFTSKMTSRWELDKSSASTSYVQTVSDGTAVEVPVNPSKTVEAIAAPFMVIPHTKGDLTSFSVAVTLQSGDVRTASLASIFDEDGLLPGRMYVITLSGLDAKYPPVENLQGMAGNKRVSLNWDNPEPTHDWIKQCGVTVKIIQKGKDKDGNPIQADELVATRYWADSDKNKDNTLFPANKSDLDLFAYITEGVNSKGETVYIDTRTYDEFECHVIADYYNTEEQSYKDGQPVIHHSIARVITIKPETNDDTVLFYIPEGAKTPDGLLDDDDVAAWDWFKKTYPFGKYVTKDGDSEGHSLEELMNDGFNVIWVPCGVQLRGGDDFRYDTSVEDPDGRLAKVNSILQQNPLPDYLTKMGREYYDDYVNNHAEDLKQGARVPGAYNEWNTGLIKRVADVNSYFTQNDINAIRSFYAAGGNLLLTTFSIELAVEFGVITYNSWRFNGGDDLRNECRPFFHLFNEVKPSSIWFLRSEFGSHNAGSHPLYEGLFKCTGDIFPEAKNDIHDQEDNDETNFIYVGSDLKREVPMYPLLSMGADACENNNIVWDFTPNEPHHQMGKTMANMEEQCNGRFLGTWGQISDDNVGVVFEFYPGGTGFHSRDIYSWNSDFFNHLTEEERSLGNEWIEKAFWNHGRCIAIGLGAYEFNNGLRYDPSEGVKNYYQSNVQRITSNALKYLMTVDNN